MKTPHQPNANPLVEQIVQAYLKTHLSEAQFEALVEQTILQASGAGSSSAEEYDRGFSDGYDAGAAEQTRVTADLNNVLFNKTRRP